MQPALFTFFWCAQPYSINFEPDEFIFSRLQSVEGSAERLHEVDEGGRPHKVDELAERLPESRGSRNRNSGPEEDHKGRSDQN